MHNKSAEVDKIQTINHLTTAEWNYHYQIITQLTNNNYLIIVDAKLLTVNNGDMHYSTTTE